VSAPAGDLAPVRLRTHSAEDTRALGAALARGLRPGDMVLLAGDLGAGKTTLAQGVAVGLGVDDHVTSPTFTLVRSYPCRVSGGAAAQTGATPDSASPGPTVATFVHADLYRLERLGEVADLALGELVEDDAVAVVEWGDVAEPVLGTDALSVRMGAGPGEDERCVTITGTGQWAERWRGLAQMLGRWAAP
jgi:tRNA threonylcarbamoyladenosine biosynthesis protein TsaE